MEKNKRDEDKPRTHPVVGEDELSGSIDEPRTSSTSKEEKSTQQVAIAQSSIRRLQMVVKEKEDIIVTLQNAVSEAYQAALQEQAYDQAQLEALQEVFLANAGGQHHTTSAANLHKALQAMARQGPDAKSSMGITSTLIKAVAKLMDDHLQQLVSSHEHEIQGLQKNMDFFKDQNQILETQLAEERMQHQLHINNIVEEVRKQIPEDDQQRRNEVEKYQNQLKNKGSKLKALREEMRLMELRLMNAQQKTVRKEENTVSTAEYAKMRAKVSYFQSQVATLAEQLREAKQTAMEAQLADHVNSQAVKQLQEETTKRKEITHRLAVQLAQHRHKEKQSEATPARNYPPLLENKSLVLDDSDVTPEDIIQAAPHIHIFQDRGFAEKCGDFVRGNEYEISQETLAKKIQNLQTKLRKCRGDLKESEGNRVLSEKMMQEFKTKAHRYRQFMLEKKQKLLLEKHKQASSADCMKIKQLLETLEKVENDNSKLQKVVMVDQESSISKLKKEVTKLKHLCFDMGKEDAECNIHEYNLPTMEDTIIPDKENEVIQLKFDRDQAVWKLGQLERRMHILFGAGFHEPGKTEVTCEYFISPTTAPHAFAGKKLLIQEPNAISLMRDFTRKNLPTGSSPRGKELEFLVEGLLRVVEKKRLEVEHLQQACQDTIQHIERSKQLQQQMDELRGKLWNNDECCQSGLIHHSTIAELKNDVENLTQSNKNLMHLLKETENSYVELQEKLYETTKDKFSPKKRCSFNEDEQHELSDLEVQAQEISRLRKELREKSQTISDLKSQLEARDDELDYLHGQLAIKEALENEQNEKITKHQMAKENTDVDLLSLEDLQMANEELAKVCDQYEALLERQAEQLGISFEPIRNIK